MLKMIEKIKYQTALFNINGRCSKIMFLVLIVYFIA